MVSVEWVGLVFKHEVQNVVAKKKKMNAECEEEECYL